MSTRHYSEFMASDEKKKTNTRAYVYTPHESLKGRAEIFTQKLSDSTKG